MSSVSTSSGADIDSGGGLKFEKYANAIVTGDIFIKNFDNYNKSMVPNKSVKRNFRKQQISILSVSVLLPVLFGILCIYPGGCHAGKTKKDSGSKPGNFSQSPTNHEDVLARKKETVSNSGISTNDDYWVGSHKLEFKPHPLLMPSTQSPAAQIPIPIIEMGMTPTITPLASNVEGGEVDDLSEAASNTSEEEKKGKTRKSRGGRKKSRDQRRLAHRTLWERQNAANNISMIRALQNNPYFLHNHHQFQQQQSPTLLTAAGNVIQHQNPLLIAPQNVRNDDNFHGSAATWSINHPGNGIVAPNIVHSYMPTYAVPQNSGQVITGSSSHETSQQVQQQSQLPQQYRLTFPQFMQQQQLLAAQFATQQRQQSQQIPLQISPMTQGQHNFRIMPSAPDYLQQSGSTPVMISGSNGPVLMYYGPSGAGTTAQGLGQIPSASGPIPAKPFNINEVPGAVLPPHLQFNQITGPDFSGAHNHLQYPQQNAGTSSSSGSSTNPQYFRNNFIRAFMDKMASVGRLIPIPFVTKYASPPPPNPQQQGYNRHNHFSRRMKK